MSAYARVAVARSGSGWTVSGNDAALVADATFPAMASGAGGTVTHFGVGTTSSGSGHLLFLGTVTPNLVVSNGVTPILAGTTSKVSQASSDGMSNEAATNLLLLIFNNTAWANVGDASGLQPSATAGSLYLSLHTSTPAEAGAQNTNEISYS